MVTFAHTSFKWRNLATHNAGVAVVIIGLSARAQSKRQIYEERPDGQSTARTVDTINAYLLGSANTIVVPRSEPISPIAAMLNGNKAVDGGHLGSRLIQIQ